MITGILIGGGSITLVGALLYAFLGGKRTGTETKTANAADRAVLSVVIELVGENDIDAAIKVLELQRERKKPA